MTALARSSVLLLIAAVLIGCATQRQSPFNPYVDGPLIIAETKQILADALDARLITSDTAKRIRAYATLAEAALATAKLAAAAGDLTSEQTALATAMSFLETLRKWNTGTRTTTTGAPNA